jgi:hypothetical protein
MNDMGGLSDRLKILLCIQIPTYNDSVHQHPMPAIYTEKPAQKAMNYISATNKKRVICDEDGGGGYKRCKTMW